MSEQKVRPSTETEATPRPPTGENMKDLVTPGQNSEPEADAQTARQKTDAPKPADPEIDEEAQSPT